MKRHFRGLAALLMLPLLAGPAQTAQAAEPVPASQFTANTGNDPTDGTKEVQEVTDLINNVKKMPVQSNARNGWPAGPETAGTAAIVMEAGTGAVLYAKNIDKREYPASITKVLTALLALENGQLTDPVTVTHECVSFLQPGDSSVGLKEGNKITLDQAMHAMLLASGNEAAYSVGANVAANAGHDYQWFIQQMNARAQALGATNSNFVNTNGLHDDRHYTTAHDMAVIGRELFKHQEFLDITQTLSYKIPASATSEEHVFQQKDKILLKNTKYHYEPAVAGKTGFTSKAKNTLVTLAQKDGVQLVCVVLHTYGSNIYTDTINLLNYAFDNFQKVAVDSFETSKQVKDILNETGSGYVMLPKGIKPDNLERAITKDPESAGLIDINYSYGGLPVGYARAVADTTAKAAADKAQAASVKTAKTKTSRLPALARFIKRPSVLVALGVLVLLIGLDIFSFYKRRQRKRRQRRRLPRK